MRKFLLLVTAITLGLCLFAPAQTRAEGESGETDKVVHLAVGSASGEVGDEVEVPVLLSDCAGVDSLELDLNYDPAALRVVKITPGDLFPVEYCVTNADQPGVIHIACASALGLEGDGTLLTVRLQILTAAGSALTVTTHLNEKEITYIDADYNQFGAYLTLENGGVSVGGTSAPAPLVTPWTPATPIPTPTPSPTPTVEPTFDALALADTPAPSAEPELSGQPDPGAYYIIGALTALLVVLIVFSVVRRKKAKAAAEEDER